MVHIIENIKRNHQKMMNKVDLLAYKNYEERKSFPYGKTIHSRQTSFPSSSIRSLQHIPIFIHINIIFFFYTVI